MPSPGRRPEVDRAIDQLLRTRLSAAHHRAWWDAEAAAFSGLSPREALAIGRRDAVVRLATGDLFDEEVVVSSAQAEDYFRQMARGQRRRE